MEHHHVALLCRLLSISAISPSAASSKRSNTWLQKALLVLHKQVAIHKPLLCAGKQAPMHLTRRDAGVRFNAVSAPARTLWSRRSTGPAPL